MQTSSGEPLHEQVKGYHAEGGGGVTPQYAQARRAQEGADWWPP